MTDPIPPPPPRSGDGCWKWGAIGCIAVALIGAIAVGVVVFVLIRSDAFKGMMSKFEGMAAVEAQLKTIGDGLNRYQKDKGTYPDDLNALVPKYVADKQSLRVGKGHEYEAVYLKPPKNAGPEYRVIKVNLPAPVPMAGAPPVTVWLRLDGKVEGTDYTFRQGGGTMRIDFPEAPAGPSSK